MHGIQTQTSAGRPQDDLDPMSRLMPGMCHSAWQSQRKPDIMLTMLCPGGTLAMESSMPGLLHWLSMFSMLKQALITQTQLWDNWHSFGIWEKSWLRAWGNFYFRDVGENTPTLFTNSDQQPLRAEVWFYISSTYMWFPLAIDPCNFLGMVTPNSTAILESI